MDILDELAEPPPRTRGLFCNRTLNLRAIRAVGYDMDYTLIHYRMEAWEERAYEHLRRRLSERGWPVGDLVFDPELVIRGLVIDTRRGNLVKCNRFGNVKRAFHGTRPLDYEEQRRLYARTIVDLEEKRWVFLNTLFSLSEACMYAQLVDLLDEHRLPEVMGYADLYRRVRASLDAAHVEGALKAEILAAPERFVVEDPETPLALLDQKSAGKKVMLVTNSEWTYTAGMMRHAFDPYLPDGRTWRDLFDLVIVSARKPEFFSTRSPIFEIVSEDGLLRPHVGPLRDGRCYLGGDATVVEEYLGASGDEILYVGDHVYGDVHVSKSLLRWRTALILRELEDDLEAAVETRDVEAELAKLMEEKQRLELFHGRLRLQLLRTKAGYGPVLDVPADDVHRRLAEVRARLTELDDRIAPLARAASAASNRRWGLVMRAGNDKSHLARQVERWADVYTSRVSNFLLHTPYAFLRPPRGSLPHDPAAPEPGASPAEGALE